MSHAPGPRVPPDLRLAFPAASAWVAAAVVLPHPARFALGLAAVAALVACGLLLAGRRRVLAGCLVAVAVAGVAVGLRVQAVQSSPLHLLARDGAAAQVRLVITADPRAVRPAVTGPRRAPDTVLVRGRALAVTARGSSTGLAVPVLVLAPAQGWSELLPSQQVTAQGVLTLPRGGDLTAAVLRARGAPTGVSSPSLVQRIAGRLRAGLRDASAPLPAAEGGLLPGLVVGDTTRLPPEVEQDFRDTGMTHLTAVSGSNVAVVIGAAVLLAGLVGIGVKGRCVAALLAVGGFAVLARPDPSVLRASVMGAIAVLAVASGRDRAALPALSGAVLLLVLADPGLARAPGFGLSVLATVGLLILAPPLRDRLARRMPRLAAEALAVPLAAQLACAPLITALFGQVSLIAVPANLLAAAAVAPATVLGVAAALLSPVWLDGAQLLTWVAAWPCRWLVHVAAVGAAVPGGSFGWGTGAFGAATLLLGGGGVLMVTRSQAVRRAVAVAGVPVLLVGVGLRVVHPGWPPPGWLMVACDVGQGDALVLAAGPGTAVVVDAGPDPAAVDRCLRDLRVRRVPVVLLTHLHADHVEGLPGVLRGREVGEVVVGPLDEPLEQGRRVREWAETAGVGVAGAPVGQRRSVGALSWEVLSPVAGFHGTSSDPNNSSVVVRVRTAGVRVLLTGDVEPPAQEALLRSGTDLRAEVLKIPHHGSDHQSPDFLAASGAVLALASLGADNTYGHPSPRTLDTLARAGARTLRTDTLGAVAVVGGSGRVGAVGREGEGADAPSPAPPGRDGVAPTGPRPGQAGPRPGQAEPAHVGTPVAADRLGRGAGGQPGARAPPGHGTGGAWEHDGVAASAPVVAVVRGAESLLVGRAVADLLVRFRAGDPDLEVTEVAGAELDLSQLMDLTSPSLFGDRRLVVVRDSQDLDSDVLDALVSYVAHADEESRVVVVHDGGVKGKKLPEAAIKAGAHLTDCPKLTKPAQRMDFLRAEFHGVGRTVGDPVLRLLMETVGTDLRGLASAASQLASDVAGPLDERAVGRYYQGRVDVKGFAVADRALEGDAAGALELLRWALLEGLAPVLVTSAFGSGLRNLAKVGGKGRANPFSLAKELGMPPWQVEKAQRQLVGWGPRGLSVATREVARADAGVKGGSVDASYALERMVLDVVGARDST